MALAFDDESTKPSGMFGDKTEARALADGLAAEWHVPVVVTQVV
ncbi:MAG: hypothetical protein VB139_01555 [Coriobacteriia bacterium]|nr:hypothetical protein [Coriobacteriia bacterium]